jgi:hypothetical protein
VCQLSPRRHKIGRLKHDESPCQLSPRRHKIGRLKHSEEPPHSLRVTRQLLPRHRVRIGRLKHDEPHTTTLRSHHHGQMAARAGPLQAMPPMIPKRAMVSSKHTSQLPKTKKAQDRGPKCRELTPPALGGGRGADKSRRRVGWEGGVQGRLVYPVGRAAGARRPAEAGPWGLSDGPMPPIRGFASGMGV